MLIEPERAEGCLSDLRLDRYRVGELDASAREVLETHLTGCIDCTARLAALREDAEAFAGEPVPLVLARGRTRPAWLAPTIAAALALAAALAVMWLRPTPAPSELPDDDTPSAPRLPLANDDGTRVKGAPSLGVHARRGGKAVRLVDGDTTHPGDTLRFEVSCATPQHVAVLSVDGAGTISAYHPTGPRAERVEPGQHVVLDGAIELDDVLGRETLHAVFCSEAVAVDELRAALERDRDAPHFADGCTSARMVLEKRR